MCSKKLRRSIATFFFLIIFCIGAQSLFALENNQPEVSLTFLSSTQFESNSNCEIQKGQDTPLSKDCLTQRSFVFQKLLDGLYRKKDSNSSFLFIKESDDAQEISVSAPAQKKFINIFRSALAVHIDEPRIEILSSRSHPPTNFTNV